MNREASIGTTTSRAGVVHDVVELNRHENNEYDYDSDEVAITHAPKRLRCTMYYVSADFDCTDRVVTCFWCVVGEIAPLLVRRGEW